MELKDINNIKEVKNLKATLQASYYGKAKIVKTENNDLYLLSYSTIVCCIVKGQFIRLWNGYSKTTKNHINDFRLMNNLSMLNKKEWLAIPCINSSKEQFKIECSNGFVNWIMQPIFDSYEQASNVIDNLSEKNSRLYFDIVKCLNVFIGTH